MALEGICTCLATPFVTSMCGFECEMCDMGIPNCRVVVLFVGLEIGYGGRGMGGS